MDPAQCYARLYFHLAPAPQDTASRLADFATAYREKLAPLLAEQGLDELDECGADGLSSDAVMDLAEDSHGQLWFATQQWPSRYDGQRFTSFAEEDDAPYYMTCVATDSSGGTWFGTWHDGAFHYDGNRFSAFTTEDGLADNNVNCIAEDRHGRMWFGTWGGGLCRYDGAKFTTFTTADGLAHNMIRAIMEDRRGHEKGAFTGAISRKLGKVELASRGTLFLEERAFERVGGTRTFTADARVVPGALERGIWLSRDGGDTWEDASAGLGHRFALAARFNPTTPARSSSLRQSLLHLLQTLDVFGLDRRHYLRK